MFLPLIRNKKISAENYEIRGLKFDEKTVAPPFSIQKT